jgi:hypothetical protein
MTGDPGFRTTLWKTGPMLAGVSHFGYNNWLFSILRVDYYD